MQQIDVHALAHITGGGLLENIPRVLPDECCAEIDLQAWQQEPIFDWLQSKGNVEPEEMYRTFNCGIGMIVCVAEEDAVAALSGLQQAGETVWQIGQICIRREGEKQVLICG